MHCITYLGISMGSLMISTILIGVCNSDEYKPLWTMSKAIQDNNSTMYDLTTDTCHTVKSPHGDNDICTDCIDFYQFHFLFPKSARKEDMWLCGNEIHLLCSSYMPEIASSWQNCSIAALLIIFGITMHLTSLSYERSKLGEERKLRDKIKERFYINQHVKSEILRNSIDASTLLISDKK